VTFFGVTLPEPVFRVAEVTQPSDLARVGPQNEMPVVDGSFRLT